MLTLNSVIQNLKNSGNKNIIAVYKSIIYNQLSRHVQVLFDQRLLSTNLVSSTAISYCNPQLGSFRGYVLKLSIVTILGFSSITIV